MEFLADLFPDAKLLPADPIARAKVRLFAHLIDTKFIPAFAGCVFLGGPPEPLYAMLDTLQAFLPPDGGYVAGDWSIADAAFIPWFLRLEAILALNPVTMSPEVAEAASGMVRSERFARLQQWKRDNVARPTMAKTYDEVWFYAFWCRVGCCANVRGGFHSQRWFRNGMSAWRGSRRRASLTAISPSQSRRSRGRNIASASYNITTRVQLLLRSGCRG